MHFHIQGQSYQFKALPSGLSTAPMVFIVVAKEVKLIALQRGIRIHQYLDDWLVRATSHQTWSPAYTDLGSSLSRTWLAGEQGEVRTGPKKVLNYVGYQFDLREGKVRPTPECWQTLTDKIVSILSGPVCPVRQFMSLIGLLTATEKQVHLSGLHMRPIQWHLKNNWRIPESLEKVIPVPRSLHPDLKWWLDESNVLPGQPLHPRKHALQIFTDASKEGWGTHLNERTARGTWSDLCSNNIVLVATDNTIVVAYINKEGGMKSGSLCALLWRILSWCTKKQVTLKARHIPGWLNVIADKLSRLGQTIQTEWSLHPEVFQAICHQIQQQTPTVCVTSSRPPGLGSGCTQPVLGKSGPICLPTSSHLGQSGGEVTGLPLQQDHSDCTRVGQHALVLGSSGNVQSDPSVSAQPAQSGISTIQPDSTQEPVKPEPTCLAPRATAIKEQGFSEAVAARIEAPQRGSTRSVYEAKWTIFTKW